MIYGYYSPYGLFTIRQLVDDGRWLLFLDNKVNSYGPNTVRPWPTAEAAADAVAQQQTGFDIWDLLPPVQYPTSLDDWIQLPATPAVPRTDTGGE